MKLYRTGLLLLAVLCTIPVFAGQPPRLKVGSSSGIFGPVTNWTYETFAEAKRAGIDAIEISASTLFLNKEMTDDRQIEARCPSAEARPQARRNRNLVGAHAFRPRDRPLADGRGRAAAECRTAPPRAALLQDPVAADRAVPPELVSRARGARRAGSRSWCARSGSCFPMRRRSAPGW